MKVILESKPIELNLGSKMYISKYEIVMEAESITYDLYHGFTIKFNSMVKARKAYDRVKKIIPSISMNGIDLYIYRINEDITLLASEEECREVVLNVKDGWYYPETKIKQINAKEMKASYKTVDFIPCEAPNADGTTHSIIVNVMHGHIFQTIKEVPCTN